MAREKLVEIKKGNTGTGLLLENDGYITINSKENKSLLESIGFDNGERNLPNPFIVHAVFQKFGIENANGRIYPEEILKREVNKYQQAIKERRAYGECYTPDVLILTEDGWKTLSDVKEGDNVLSLNPDSKEIEIKPVVRKIEREHNGDMIHIKGRHIDDLVTPEHKFPLFNRDGKFKGAFTSEDIFNNNINDIAKTCIYKNGEWTNKGEEYFVLRGIENPDSRMLKNHPDCKEDVKIKMSSFMKFMGIYLSEGDFKKGNLNDVNITQKKEDVCILIEEMLTELPFKYRVSGKDKKSYTICDPRLHAYVKQFGNCYTKYVPFEIKQQSKENLRIFYDWFVLGDGRIRGDKRLGSKTRRLSDDVFSTSKQLVLDLNEIQLKIGYNGSYHMENRDYDRFIEGRLIEGKNCHPMYFTSRSLSRNIWLDKRFISVSKEKYNGTVMCVEVADNHNWYVMSNGHCHWTNNCNHPEGAEINVSRIAMNIIELHWEGRTLVGQMELPITDGFRKFGIISCCADEVAQWILSGLRVGVSSRGLGSVEQIGGKLVVSDDYEIVCWDVVTQNSTPGAIIGNSKEALAPFIESVQQNDNQSLIKEDKFTKFENWLND